VGVILAEGVKNEGNTGRIHQTNPGNVEGQDALKVQAGTARRLERLIKGQAVSKLRKRPAAGKWSVGEILAHLADTEMVTGWRMRQILGSPGVSIQAFDQDSWAAACHYDRRDPRKAIEQFRVPREANLALLSIALKI
jgi:DinB superfamily